MLLRADCGSHRSVARLLELVVIEHPTLRQVLGQKTRVYQALILRHIIMRYGRANLGFVWVLVEPMFLCVGVMGIWALSKGQMEHGLQLSAIAYTGYMPLTLWRHMTNSMGYVLRAGKHLTSFRGITLLDVVFSRILMEFVAVTAASLVVYAVLSTVGILPEIYSVGEVLIGWLLMGALGLGGGLLIAGATEASEVSEKFIPPLQYLMLPFSGCFFLLDWLPSYAREALSYVPFVHAFEMIRGGYFGPVVTTYSDPAYAFAWALVMVGSGLFFVETVRDRVEP